MNTLDYIIKKFDIDINQFSPFVLECDRMTVLPELFKELGFKKGAEVGVFEGVFSEVLCKGLPDATIYSIDAWKYYPVHKDFRKAKHYEPIYKRAVETLSQYPNSVVIRKWSMDAVKDFDDKSLDFVFIDSDHRFQFITNDIAEWSKKVKIGGIISGHDFMEGYASFDFVHVKKVVESWTHCYRIHPWFVLKAPGQESWMWVKTRDLPI